MCVEFKCFVFVFMYVKCSSIVQGCSTASSSVDFASKMKHPRESTGRQYLPIMCYFYLH
jgi:hypothetical protein